MPDDPVLFHSDMLVGNDWSSFFEDLTQSHQGRSVTVEQGNDLLLDSPPGQGVPLKGIELYNDHKQQSLVITTATQTYTIETPYLIWVVRNEQGELVALQISDAGDREFIVRFV